MCQLVKVLQQTCWPSGERANRVELFGSKSLHGVRGQDTLLLNALDIYLTDLQEPSLLQ